MIDTNKINMSKLAKSVANKTGENWINYMDTYRHIPEDEILEQDKKGYDLYQIVNDKWEHQGFKWELR